MEAKASDAALEALESETEPMVGKRRTSILDSITGDSAGFDQKTSDRRASQALLDRRLSSQIFQGPNPTM